MNFEEILSKVLDKFKDKYPIYTFEFKKPNEKRKNLIHFTVNDKILYKFDSIFIQKEIEFIENSTQYIYFLFTLFDDYVKPYHKTRSSALHVNSTPGLSIQQVESACASTLSNGQASRYLGVSYRTWKKYASKYTLPNGKTYFEEHLNLYGKGIPKTFAQGSDRANLDDILNGLHPKYPSFKLKNRLIKLKLKEEKCEQCGFEEHRIGDARTPLMLDYIDGNPLNKSLKNIRFLCYNCYFMYVGDIFWRKKGDFMPPMGNRTGHYENPKQQYKIKPENKEILDNPKTNNIYIKDIEDDIKNISISDLEKENNETKMG